MARTEDLKCLLCGAFFVADARNTRHQKYCSAPACRKESKAASHRAWLAKSDTQNYFRGAENVARVKSWREAPRGIGDDRKARGEKRRQGRQSQLRYKMSAPRNPLKSLASLKTSCNLRYKMSGLANPLL